MVNVAPGFRIVADRDPARLFLQDLGGQVQAVASAFLAGREEGFEDAIDVGLWERPDRRRSRRW